MEEGNGRHEYRTYCTHFDSLSVHPLFASDDSFGAHCRCFATLKKRHMMQRVSLQRNNSYPIGRCKYTPGLVGSLYSPPEKFVHWTPTETVATAIVAIRAQRK
mmetsp:Transcript_6742/g.15399  ORF Transcript_6742/g.15399 Transcript_6742/m.15399 type:complete len:103 (-) Transcript_6742:630-938(-)